jgi:hypothetical protein
MSTVPLGVLLGHGVGYLVAHPDAADRTGALAGHAYHAGILDAAIPLAAAAVVLSLLAGRRGGARSRTGAASLAAWQIAVFVGLELAEHVAAGSGLAGALAEPGLWWGAVAQVPVALAAVGLLRLSHQAGRRLAAGRSIPARRRPPPTATPVAAPTRTVVLPITRRGPPVAAAP